jgi:hypothetical protein
MRLETSPGGIDPDGAARWIVRVRFVDSAGKPTTLLQGGDIEFAASRGRVQWQTRTRFGGPAAIVSTTEAGPLSVRAIAKAPAILDDARADTDTRTWRFADVAARALGPHLVQIGWFPAATGAVSVVRSGPGGLRTVCDVAPQASTCRDTQVRPGATYRYAVTRSGARAAVARVNVPAAAPGQSLAAIRGKGMWLRFSPDPRDDDAFQKLDAAAIVERAQRSGLRYIELRLAYGEFWEVSPAAKPFVDALLDAAAAEGIAVIAWTVPRAASYADLALAVAAANYRTPRGTRISGLALDLERGDEFLGDGPAGRVAIAEYAQLAREALGPSALILSTVEDPFLTGLTNRDFPFATVARYASALQPMTYWRMFRRGTGEDAATSSVRDSMQALRREAGRSIQINVGGQTADLGSCGAPTTPEILASLDESRRAGAIGETFYDWFGTREGQWDAIASFVW